MQLNEIQQKLKAPKSQYNSFGKYYYRNAEDILEAVKPLLGDSVLTLSDEVVQVGNRNYVKATATFTERGEEDFLEEMEDATYKGMNVVRKMKVPSVVSVTAYACEAEDRKGMDASQITGAASSYARKYALNGLFLIDDTKDADHDDNTPVKPSQAAYTPRSATPAPKMEKDPKIELLAKKDRIMKLLKLHEAKRGTERECSDSVFELTDLPLTEDHYEDIIDRLAALLDEKNSK